MPRPRKVVMGTVTPQEAHDAAIKLAVKKHKPYAVVEGNLVGDGDSRYTVVFTAPLGGERKIVASRNKYANATALRDMLNNAWAEGFWASMREEGK